MSQVLVKIDIHEPPELVMEAEEHGDVEDVKLSSLDSADIAIEGIGFERKTPSDYSSSLTSSDNRLKKQVNKMNWDYEDSYILLEGSFNDFHDLERTRINPKCLMGSSASFTARDDTPVIPCGNQQHLIDIAVRIARKHTESPTSQSLATKSSADIDEPFTKRVFGCLDGVGQEMSDALYVEFSSIEELLNASQRDLEDIDGIGEKRAESIKKQMNGEQE